MSATVEKVRRIATIEKTARSLEETDPEGAIARYQQVEDQCSEFLQDETTTWEIRRRVILTKNMAIDRSANIRKQQVIKKRLAEIIRQERVRKAREARFRARVEALEVTIQEEDARSKGHSKRAEEFLTLADEARGEGHPQMEKFYREEARRPLTLAEAALKAGQRARAELDQLKRSRKSVLNPKDAQTGKGKQETFPEANP